MSEYISHHQMEYDPSVDPDNIQQFSAKDYSVVTVYKKIANNPSKDSDNNCPPNYLEAISDSIDDDFLPSYQETTTNRNKVLERLIFHFTVISFVSILCFLCILYILSLNGCM